VQDPFPLEAVCGKVWRHGEGQLSFLKHAVTAPPEIFTFVHSSRKQVRTLLFVPLLPEFGFYTDLSCIEPCPTPF